MSNPVGAEEDDGLELHDDEREHIRKAVLKKKQQMFDDSPKIFADLTQRLSRESGDVIRRY